MNAQAASGIEEYLVTSFASPDPEYKDGALVERSLPDYLHGKIQLLLGAFFLALRGRYPVFPSVETRMRLRPGLVLIPDIAVFYPEEPALLPEAPPLIVIEVLSVDDRMGEVRAKLSDYRNWGVNHVWLVDPHSQRFYTCDDVLREVSTLIAPELNTEITRQTLFS